MKTLLKPVLAIALTLGAASGASAASYNLTANLTGTEEVPVNASPATGNAIVDFDDVAQTMRVQINFSGLLGNTTASHVHAPAPIGTNVAVATQLPTFAGFPLGVTSGSYDFTFDMTLASSYASAFITNYGGGATAGASNALLGFMLGGLSYVNVHTNLFPGGEIRGQLRLTPGTTVPEPAALSLFGLGALGLALARRRRRV